jgi:pimeloyl-ACP methyl ester carboxylesterase
MTCDYDPGIAIEGEGKPMVMVPGLNGNGQLYYALVLVNAFPHFPSLLGLRLAIAGLRLVPWRTFSVLWRFTTFLLHSPETAPEEVKRFVALTAPPTRRGYRNRVRLLRNYDVRDRLHELRPSTLFLASGTDHLLPSVTQARYMVERVRNGTLRVLEGHGHVCLIAPSVDLAEIIRNWRSDADRE